MTEDGARKKGRTLSKKKKINKTKQIKLEMSSSWMETGDRTMEQGASPGDWRLQKSTVGRQMPLVRSHLHIEESWQATCAALLLLGNWQDNDAALTLISTLCQLPTGDGLHWAGDSGWNSFGFLSKQSIFQSMPRAKSVQLTSQRASMPKSMPQSMPLTG